MKFPFRNFQSMPVACMSPAIIPPSSLIDYVGGVILGYAPTDTIDLAPLSLTGLTGGIGSAPINGDLIIAAYAIGSSGVEIPTIVTSGYTSSSVLYANDIYDTNLAYFTKFAGVVPDTNIVGGPTGATSAGGALMVRVYRGVDPAIFDVASTDAIATNTARPTPPPITPVSNDVKIVCIGASARGSAVTTFSGGNLGPIITAGSPSGTRRASLGGCDIDANAGLFTPIPWTIGSDNTDCSMAAFTLALKPL